MLIKYAKGLQGINENYYTTSSYIPVQMGYSYSIQFVAIRAGFILKDGEREGDDGEDEDKDDVERGNFQFLLQIQ